MENKEFLSYSQCQALAELNYDGDYDYTYHATGELWERIKKAKVERHTPAPLKQQAFRWFREKYQFHPEIVVQLGFKHWNAHILPSGEWLKRPTPTGFKTYEEAEDACIDKLIEIAKQQDK
jgi:hypothetical protein